MLAVGVVRLTNRELVAQASDDVWFQLMMKLQAQNQGSASGKIQDALRKPAPANKMLRRVTFQDFEVPIVMNTIHGE